MYTGERHAPPVRLYEARKAVLRDREQQNSFTLVDAIASTVRTLAWAVPATVAVMGIAAGLVWYFS